MNLNDDVLFRIFEYLDVWDQASVALADPRFKKLIDNMWKRSVKHLERYMIYHDLDRMVHMFLGSVCDTVETVEVYLWDAKHWKVLKQFSFPKVWKFHVEFTEKHSQYFVVEMTKSFPNLRSLTLDGKGIIGKDVQLLKKFRFLEHLSLRCAEFKDIQKLFEDFPLKSFECSYVVGPCKWTSKRALKNFYALECFYVCNSNEMLPSSLEVFKNLKEFCIEYFDEVTDIKVFTDVATSMHNKLTELSVRLYIQLSSLLTRPFENLSKVKICQGYISDAFDIIGFAPNLREIYLIDCSHVQEEEILRLLSSTQYEFIEISQCVCGFSVLDLNIEELAKSRTTFLHFNFKGNRHYEDDTRDEVKLNVVGSSDLLKITSKSIPCRLSVNLPPCMGKQIAMKFQ